MTTRNEGVGIDVSKAKVDVAVADGTWQASFEQTAEDLDALAEELRGRQPHRIVVEATGGYERHVLAALHASGLPVVLIEPARGRHFARSLGRRAKTDAIDARVLALMARSLVDDDPLWAPRDPITAQLHELVTRRQQLVQQVGDERRRLKQLSEGTARDSVERVVGFLLQEVKDIETAIDALVASDDDTAESVAALESPKGVGRNTAVALLCLVPELGTLARRKIAALVGVAPFTVESGQYKGASRIQGGRALARRLLYMVALVAVRHNAHIKAFYARLRARGKPAKVALTACMRKLLIHLNSIMRTLRARRLERMNAC